MENYILALMLALAPGRPETHLRPMARAIALSTNNMEDAMALNSIQFHETSFHLRTIYPFGLTCCFNQERRSQYRAAVNAYLANITPKTTDHLVQSLTWAARRANEIYQRGKQLCGDAHGALWFYNTGECPTESPPQQTVDRRRWYRGKNYATRTLASIQRIRRHSRQ